MRWRDPAGRQRKKTFERRVDAQRFLATISADVVRGTYVDPNDPTTFSEYAEAWREAQVHRPTTRARVETNLRRHAYPYFGDRRLSTIRPSEIQGWVTTLSRRLSPATVQVIHGIVAAIFKAAVRDRLVGRLVGGSRCDSTRLPKKRPIGVMPLSTSTVHALAEAVPERYRAIVLLGAGTGLRQGECFGLDDEHIDFDRHTLRVDQQLLLLPHREPFLGPPKTSASYRTIPLPGVVVDALRQHLRSFPVQHIDRLVFTDDDGRAISRTRFSREVWRPAVAAAGARRGTGFHDLRHYYASLLIRHGESVKTVQRRLGHATAAETLDTYAHLWPDSEDRTRNAIDSVLRAARPAAPHEGARSSSRTHFREGPMP
ncbi:tyrosine-type recombinase/integrase [Pseudonocardia nigra]|uniref:tyrosine-type recombinase/integrase n=1 Tax=Pseudonocardia nigra TaxID=1921578 RepID=UPI001C5F6E89|nr:site-specific integrase [Pseudonocardia nigra]